MNDLGKYRIWHAQRDEMKLLGEVYRLFIYSQGWAVRNIQKNSVYASSDDLTVYPHRLLRWTGAKDKDGIEIFDQDIVHYTGSGTYHHRNLVVYWSAYHMGWAMAPKLSDVEKGWGVKMYDIPSHYRVIGNAFQYAALLREDSNHGEIKTIEDDMRDMKQEISYLRSMITNHLIEEA